MHDDHEIPEDDTRADIPAAAPVSALLAPQGQHHAGPGGFRSAPEPWPQAGREAPEVFVPMTFSELAVNDRVILYGKILRVAKEPFRHTPLDSPPGTPCEASGGWVHLRLWWDGRESPTAERAEDLVAVSRPGRG